MMQKLAFGLILAAAPLSAVRRATTQERDFAAEVLANADMNSDGKGSYAELSSVVSKLGDVDQNAAMSFLEQQYSDVDEDADGLLNVDEVAKLVSAFRDQLAEDGPAADPTETLMENVLHEVEDEIMEGRDPKDILMDDAKMLHVQPGALLEGAAKILGAPTEEVVYGLQQEVQEMMKANKH
eukprot:TRINITY_DN12493_c0_g1_i1.p1 TRINITY_DN12493_c0_g1~~TRINITY_DN12493_c0_g1_i1.p1  ORF type:complete len:207 (+),score=59.08 TRINITY_DN12493_c0_g1_i1:76-621(+)